MPTPLVPDDFAIPTGLQTEHFILEPLEERHNQSDHAAWTTSIPHIQATPGFAGRTWPDQPMSLAENAAAIARHVRDFAARTGVAYTVIDPGSGEVIGCVYLYPPCATTTGYDADVRSWVRADRAALDKPLYDVVCRWLAESWPFRRPDYAER